jgi:hypothetical protein
MKSIALKIKNFTLLMAFSTIVFARSAGATPGEYALHVKLGPSFEIDDSDNRFKIGGEFDYELGFGFGFNLSSNIGIGSEALFQLIPAVKYDMVYFIPGTLFALAGAGYEVTDWNEQALAMRFGTGLRLPLKKPWEFITDINLFFTPSGPPGNPVTFDWLTGVGVRY